LGLGGTSSRTRADSDVMSLLEAWERAMSWGDIAALDDMLAPDLEFVDDIGRPNCGSVEPREMLLGARRQMFSNEDIRRLEFSFGGNVTTTPGSSPGIWLVEGIERTTDFTIEIEEQSRTISETVVTPIAWVVREAPGKEPPFEICVWGEGEDEFQ